LKPRLPSAALGAAELKSPRHQHTGAHEQPHRRKAADWWIGVRSGAPAGTRFSTAGLRLNGFHDASQANETSGRCALQAAPRRNLSSTHLHQPQVLWRVHRPWPVTASSAASNGAPARYLAAAGIFLPAAPAGEPSRARLADHGLRPPRGRPASERPAKGGRAAEIGKQGRRDTVGMRQLGTVIFTPDPHVSPVTWACFCHVF